MAQGDLYKLLKDSLDIIKKRDIRAEMQVFPHEFEVSAKQIEKEILVQIHNIKLVKQGDIKTKTSGKVATQPVRVLYGLGSGLTREQSETELERISSIADLSENQRKQISTLAREFAEDCLRYARMSAGKNFQVDVVKGGGTEFTIRVNQLTKPTPKNNPYEFIRDQILVPAKGTLMNNLNRLFKLGIVRKGPGAERFFNVGHVTAVSEVQASLAIRNLEAGIKNIQTTRGVSAVGKELIKLDLLSKFSSLGNPEFTKEFEFGVAYVRPQSEVSNATQSDYEGAVLAQLRKALETTIKDNPNWAEQEGSDSVFSAIAKGLATAIVESGGTLGDIKNTKINYKPNKVNEKIEQKVPAYKVQSRLGSLNIEAQSNTPSSTISLRQLIPLLNERLPEVVRRNMGIMGRLHNRTGRFAESTEVVDIGDNAVINYSYMRSPYQIFEGKGSRDPRPLIEGSIREIAAGLISQKFAMRRI